MISPPAPPAIRLGNDLLAGGLVGAIGLIRLSSLTALIFAGPLATRLPDALACFLAGAVLMTLVAAVACSYRGTVGAPQDAPAAIIAVAVGGQAAEGGGSFATALMAVALAGAATAVAMLLLGGLRLGRVVRYVPFPVVSGFLAGVAVLVVQGAIGLAEPGGLAMESLRGGDTGAWARLAAALLGGLALVVGTRCWRRVWVLPGLLLGGLLLFHAWFHAGGWAGDPAHAAAWLMDGSAATAPPWQLWSALGSVDWSLLAAWLPTLVVVPVACVLALLLNATGLELATREDVAIDRELRAGGLGNLLAATTGTVPGFPSISLTLLGRQLGGDGRLVGIGVAAVTLLALLLGTAWLGLVPRPLVAAVLLFIGLDMLASQLGRARRELPAQDRLIVLVMIVSIVAFGVLAGVAIGLISSMVLFVVQYSRLGVIKLSCDARNRRSAVDRPEAQRRLLHEQGGRIHLLRLHGYLFFGTADHLVSLVRRRSEDPEALRLGWLVIDLELVHGIDSSVVVSFRRLLQLGRQRGFALVLCHLRPAIHRELQRGGVAAADLHLLDSFDRGLEWAEDRLLEDLQGSAAAPAVPLAEALQAIAEDGVDLARLVACFQRRELPAGAVLLREGDASDDLFYLESGEVSVLLDLADGRRSRLRTLRAGTFVGELAWYLGTPRAASVLADQPCVVQRLAVADLRRLAASDPAVAAAFHRFMARFLAERLVETNATVQVLLDS